jgi:hypothetical protein
MDVSSQLYVLAALSLEPTGCEAVNEPQNQSSRGSKEKTIPAPSWNRTMVIQPAA